MKMIIGGAYQGKLCWVKTHIVENCREICENGKKERISWIDGETCEAEEIYNCVGIYHFHRYIARFLNSVTKDSVSVLEKSSEDFAKELYTKNPDLIIVTDEIGYGIVPLDPKERVYREQVGRICTALAKESEEVYRVICGIGTRIK